MDWIFAAWQDKSSADEFSKKPSWYQSMIVAAFRVQRQIEAVLTEQREMEYRKQQAQSEAQRLTQGR